ncbi:MAG: hypothetical protein ABFD97_26005 [Syntrophobacter sp.]
MPPELLIRCPRLGGEVQLIYCLQEGGKRPCARTILCWQSFLPIEAYLRKRLTQQEWDACFNTGAQDKYAALIELAERTRES